MTFRPAPLLGNRHLQTIFGPLTRRDAPLVLARERLELPDGDFVDLDSLEVPGARARLLVLHGLEGSSQSVYVQGVLRLARDAGLSGTALNFRGCSGETNRLLRSYHSGESLDLDQVVRTLIARCPATPLALCGFSLGGNVLVKWLGERSGNVPAQVCAAAGISVPFDLSRCADALDGPGGFAWLYRSRFLQTLMAKAEAKLTRHPDSVDLARLRAARSLRAFDDVFTGPVHGFTGAADYYARSSSNQFLPEVKVPLLVVSALDDPFIPDDAVPVERLKANARVTALVSPRGGHVGFIEGSALRPAYWAERRAVEFLAARAG